MKTLIQIFNWKDVVNQFGLDWAKEISKRLIKEAENGLESFLTPQCNPEQSEAIAIFEYKSFKKGKPNIAYYEYTGTAN